MKIFHVRGASHAGTARGKILVTLLFFALGFVLGMASKRLDVTPSNTLPAFLETLDLRNLFGRIAIWALIAIAIALFCKSPIRAAVNVLVFFLGMLASYCLFSVVWAGFMLEGSYLLIWVVLTVISPVLAYIVWYARGRGLLGTILSAVVIAYFILEAFSFDARFSYFDLAYGWIEILLLIAVVAMLYRGMTQTLISVGAAIALAYLVKLTGFSIPYIL